MCPNQSGSTTDINGLPRIEYMEMLCPHFYDLEPMLGKQARIVPARQHQTGDNVDPAQDVMLRMTVRNQGSDEDELDTGQSPPWPLQQDETEDQEDEPNGLGLPFSQAPSQAPAADTGRTAPPPRLTLTGQVRYFHPRLHSIMPQAHLHLVLPKRQR